MTWNRWSTRVFSGLLWLAALGGCKQQTFLPPGDYLDAVHYGLPEKLQTQPHGVIVPPTVEAGKPPATVLNPNLPARMISLKECIAIALEQGNVGSLNSLNFGSKNEVTDSFAGRTISNTDAIRAYALDPGVFAADIERSLSKFDARWITSMQWQKNDNPVAAQFVSFQSQNDQANLSSSLVKPLPTGGIAGITLSTNYVKYSNIPAAQVNSFVNPNYTPQVQFVFEQPLLQLFGVEINQLAAVNPTSLLISNLRPSGGTTTEGIVITRIRYDQARADFEAKVNYMLVNVETAYWNLYASYYNLYAQEEGLRQSYDGYRFQKARVDAGNDPSQQTDQARAQFEQFRSQVYQARGQLQESERQLRGLMGLRSDDGNRLVPIDEPNLSPYTPDFYESANETVAFRPEIVLARQDLKAQQLNLLVQRNLRRPDLRFYSSYNIAGIGTRLDGPELNSGSAGTTPGNALKNLETNQFNSWTLGLRLDMPIGFRDANAAVRQGQLQMTRSYYQLRDTELKSLEYLTYQYRQVVVTYAVIPPLRARREALQVYVAKVKEVIAIGNWKPQDFFNLLQVQRDLADSIRQEFLAIANYNSALAALEFSKGTIQRYNNVSLSEGPMPGFVQKRAAEHIRERTDAAIKLLERAPVTPAGGQSHSVGPAAGDGFRTAIPPLTQKSEAVPDALPDPRPLIPGQPMPMPPTANPVMPPSPSLPGGSNPDGYFSPVGSASIPRQIIPNSPSVQPYASSSP